MAKTKKKEETIDLSKPSKVKDEQLKKIQSDFLPKYISSNLDKYKNWID